jgi:hypothetical protein
MSVTNFYSPAWPTAYPFVEGPLPGETPVQTAERSIAEAKCMKFAASVQPDPCERRAADAWLASAQAELKALLSR